MSILVDSLRTINANQLDKFSSQIKSLEASNESNSEWFSQCVQELEMQLKNAKQ